MDIGNKKKLLFVVSILVLIIFALFKLYPLLKPREPLCDARHCYLTSSFKIDRPINEEKLISLLKKNNMSQNYLRRNNLTESECSYTISDDKMSRLVSSRHINMTTRELEHNVEEYTMTKYGVELNCSGEKTFKYRVFLINNTIYESSSSLGGCQEPYYHIQGY